MPFMATAILGTSRSQPSTSRSSSEGISAREGGSCLTLVCEMARRVRDRRLQSWGGRESKGLSERCSSRRALVLWKEEGREVRRLEIRRRILINGQR